MAKYTAETNKRTLKKHSGQNFLVNLGLVKGQIKIIVDFRFHNHVLHGQVGRKNILFKKNILSQSAMLDFLHQVEVFLAPPLFMSNCHA